MAGQLANLREMERAGELAARIGKISSVFRTSDKYSSDN